MVVVNFGTDFILSIIARVSSSETKRPTIRAAAISSLGSYAVTSQNVLNSAFCVIALIVDLGSPEEISIY